MGQMSQLRVMFYGTVKVKRGLSRACHTMAQASDARSVTVPCSHPTQQTFFLYLWSQDDTEIGDRDGLGGEIGDEDRKTLLAAQQYPPPPPLCLLHRHSF